MNQPQRDFLNTGHPFAPVPIDLRGDVRPYPPLDPAKWPDGALDKLHADIIAAPDAVFSDLDADNELVYPCPPSSPTTQAMALKAGQKHVEAIKSGKPLTDDDMARYGLHPGDYLPSEPHAVPVESRGAYYTPTGLVPSQDTPVPGDSRIYSIFASPDTERPLRTVAGANGRLRVDIDRTRFWTDEPPKPSAQGWGDEFDGEPEPSIGAAWANVRYMLGGAGFVVFVLLCGYMAARFFGGFRGGMLP